MFIVYNIETKSIEKVEKINKAIHRHRNTKEVFTFDEETSQEAPVKKIGKSKSK